MGDIKLHFIQLQLDMPKKSKYGYACNRFGDILKK